MQNIYDQFFNLAYNFNQYTDNNIITSMTEVEAEPVPTTKQQLIQMLKTQLQKVEDQITSIQTNLEQQKQKRKQLTAQLQQKQQKIKQLIENQSKTLGDKVHEGLYKTLEAANKMRADADAEIRKFAQDNTVLNQKIVHKDNIIIEDKLKILLNTKKIGSLEQKKIDAQRKKQNLQDKKQTVQKDLELMKQELQRIQRQQKQLRTHIQNMKKMRLYLNKHLEANLKNNQNIKSNKSNLPDSFWNGQ